MTPSAPEKVFVIGVSGPNQTVKQMYASLAEMERLIVTAGGIKMIDRTGVILDIFALHAKSRAGKLQVEAAQLAWQLPRLAGHGKEMSQQVGGYIGMRGPGETKIEVDRRRAEIYSRAVEEI